MSLETALRAAAEICSAREELPLSSLKVSETALLVVDMIGGFAVSGPLSSPRVGALIPAVETLARRCGEAGIRKIAFADTHPAGAAEFAVFPSHCVQGTAESELVEELKAIGGFTVIRKNSTNGFLEEEFLRLLGENPGLNTFLLAGDCTDLCVLQLALTLKAHFNRLNLSSRIIVPQNAVDTFDAPGHDAAFSNLAAFCNLLANGIEVVARIV